MQKTKKKNRLTAIDLFAGGGGLTVGLKEAGFRVSGAVEIEPHAYSTYVANHPEVNALQQDIRTVKKSSLIKMTPYGKLDLLAGCPPCQGFSSLTRKYLRKDPRNGLVDEMARLIEELRPNAVMMENVPGLVERGKSILENFIKRLTVAGYEVNYDILQVADFGIPQNRRRFALVAGKGFFIPLPKPTHSRTGKNGLKIWNSLHSVIKGMPRPVTLTRAKESGGPQNFNWHIIRNMGKENLLRLKYAKPGKVRAALPKRLRPPCHQHQDKGFNSAYGRMEWNKVSVTITGGCATFSKGRFGHPTQNRTISVREAALIQTFPMNYIFDTPYIDYACNIIGNALPCEFAQVLGEECAKALKEHTRLIRNR